MELRVAVWRKSERKKLVFLVSEYSSLANVNWVQVSVDLEADKSPMECYSQFYNVDDPTINNSPWTPNEEARIVSLAKEYLESNWVAIAENLTTNRTPWQCFQHYQQVLNPSILNRSEWTDQEDLKLKEGVQLFGDKDSWQHIADMIPGRSGFQCQMRWKRSIICNDNLVEGRWTPSEEKMLLLSSIAYNVPVSTAGKRSAEEILEMKHALGLVSRTDPSMIVDSSPTLSEHQINSAKELFARHKAAKKSKSEKSFTWAEVASLVPGKDEHKCREKFCNYLDPTINHRAFTPAEDRFFSLIVTALGPGSWSHIAQYFLGRTDMMLLRRWKQISNKKEVVDYRGKMSRKRKVTSAILGRKNVAKMTLDDESFEKIIEITPLASNI